MNAAPETTPHTLDALLTTEEAAAWLGVTPRTLDNHRYLNQGPPYIKFAHRIRYPARAVQAWLETNTRHAPTKGPTHER